LAPISLGQSYFMLLIVALLLFLIFGGIGFVAHIVWLGLILAVIIGIAHFFTGGRRSSV
jgi:uncharacterized membrane protein YjdF